MRKMRDVTGTDMREAALRAYEAMAMARAFDTKASALYKAGKVFGGVFLGRGHEAIAACEAVFLRKGYDVYAPFIREQAGRCAWGDSVLESARTYFGSVEGCMRGRDGNVHWGHPLEGTPAPISHLGAMVSVVAGMMMAKRMQGVTDAVGVACCGDGTTSVGAFHEACNLIAVQKLPVVVVNDGNAAALAEARLGVGAAKRSTLCLTVGTGLGGGFVLEKELLCGSERMAQCFGHVIVNREGRNIGENDGAAESYISGRALCVEYNRLVPAEKRVETGKQVGEKALAGESEAVEAVRIVGEWLGVALASMCACLNPEIVAIGGSVSDLDALLLDPARRSFRKNAFATIKDTPIEKAKFGGDAGLVGAALLALEHCCGVCSTNRTLAVLGIQLLSQPVEAFL